MSGQRKQRPAFGLAVKMELLRKGMTSRELAGMIGIAESTLCDVISGRNTSERTRKKILEALDLPADGLEEEN